MKVFNYRDALYEAIMDKYYEDPTLIVYGEDVRGVLPSLSTVACVK